MTFVPVLVRSRAAARAASFVLGLLGIVLAAAPARADAVGDRAQKAIDAMRAGDAAAAAEALGAPESDTDLVARPDLVHVLLDRAYRQDLRLAADVGARKALVTRLGDLAVRSQTAAPQDDRAAWALALACVLGERVGPPRGVAAWERAADLLVEVHKRSPVDGAAVSYAVTFLLEGACKVKDARHKLQTRADKITRKALRKHAESEAMCRALGATYLWAAKQLFPKDRKPAKQALRVALEVLAPHLRGEDPSLETATVFNDGVTFGKQAGFALSERYFTLPADALEGAVEFQVPLSRRWDVQVVPEEDELPGYTYVTQTDAAGNRVRQLLFRRYFWARPYRFQAGKPKFNGDNVKKVVQYFAEMTVASAFADGAKASKPSKYRLTKELVGQRFTISGTTREDEPEPLTMYGFGVRGGRQATLVVLVYVYGDAEGIGPEMQTVLDSLREPEE